MTDAYSTESEEGNVAPFADAQRRRAQGLAMDGYNFDPEDAARAMELGSATDTPATLISRDVKGFEGTLRKITGASIVGNNEALQQYVQSDPMAARVAQDDWDKLDDYTKKLNTFRPRMNRPERGFIEGFLKHYQEAGSPLDPATGQRVPEAMQERILKGMEPGASWEDLGWGIVARLGLSSASKFEVFGRAFSGLLGGMSEFVKLTAMNRGYTESQANKLAKELISVAEWKTTDMAAHGFKGPPTTESRFMEGAEKWGWHPWQTQPIDPRLPLATTFERLPEWQQRQIAPGIEAFNILKTYERAGEEVPPGVHPVVDELLRIIDEQERDYMKDAEQAADKTALKARSPQSLLEITKSLTGDREIELDVDAVRRLYGDKAPSPDDGILGWVPNLKEQISNEAEWGGRVRIPFGLWMAKTTSEVRRALINDFSLSKGGNTKADWDVLRPSDVLPSEKWAGDNDEVRLGDAIEYERRATKLTPTAASHDKPQELKLERIQPAKTEIGPYTEDRFKLIDEIGRHVGDLEIGQTDGGKNIYISWIGGRVSKVLDDEGNIRREAANVFGPSMMRQVIRQLKAEFPKAETVSGHRISGAKEKSGANAYVKIRLDELEGELAEPSQFGKNVAAFFDTVESGEWRDLGETGVRFWSDYKENWKPHEKLINEQVIALMQQIAPMAAGDMVGAKMVLSDGKPVRGFYQEFRGVMPVIMWSLASERPLGTARHEAVHFLRQMGFIKDHEWKALVKAAVEENWIGKYNIERRYKTLSKIEQLEEAIAEGYKHWGQERPVTPYSKTFINIMRLLDGIKDAFRAVMGRKVTANEVFERIETGRVGRRKPQGPLQPESFDPGTWTGPLPSFWDAEAYGKHPDDMSVPGYAQAAGGPRQPLLPNIIPMSERFPYEEGALMPKHRQVRYMAKLEAKRTADEAKKMKAAEAQVKKQASAEWQAAAKAKLPQIDERIRRSAPFAIAEMMATGKLPTGDKVKIPKIDPTHVNPDYLREIPKQWLSKSTGENPDIMAGIFGLGSGEEFLDVAAKYLLDRGNLSNKQYLNKMVGLELQRQMEAEFGKQSDVVMREAREHVWGDYQLDLLHEDTISHAMALGQQISFSKADVIAQMGRALDKMLMKDADWKNAQRATYRAGGKLEDALLRNDPQTAFLESRKKENGFALGRGIIQLDKERAHHDRLVKRYRSREPEGRDQTITPFIHDVLSRMGESGRSPTDIATEIRENKNFDSWQKLDDHLQSIYGIVAIPDFIKDPNWKADPRYMTVEEWRGVNDMLTQLDKHSQGTQEAWVAGERHDLRTMIDDAMIPAIELGAPKKVEEGRVDLPKDYRTLSRVGKALYVQHLHMETVFNWFDRNHPKGIFNQAVIRKYVEAANGADAMDKRYAAMLAKLPTIRSPHKVVKQDIFINPWTGDPLQMTRMNILGILNLMGNPSSFYTMLDGWGIDRSRAADVMKLVMNNITKADLDRQVELGKIFDTAKAESDNMYRELSGVAPKSIDKWTVDTKWGPVDGWYSKLRYDTRFPQTSEKLAAPNPLDFPAWTKSTLPSAHYTKERTGYKGPVDLSLDHIPNTLSQMIRDTSWRPALVDLRNLFKDQKFRRAIREHWGSEYEAMLDPFLKDLAGQRDFMDRNQSVGMAALQFFRQNIISHMVGLNPATIAKHSITAAINSITEVGIVPWTREFATMFFSHALGAGENNWRYAINKSEQLQARYRHYWQTVGANFDRTYGHLNVSGMRDVADTFRDRPFLEGARLAIGDVGAGLARVRDMMHFIEAGPMAFFDLASAVPTWLARYRQAKMAGENEGMAVYMADRSVRFAHGSSSIVSRSAFMRNNPMAYIFGNFYTFFSHILQKQVMMAWATRASLRGEGVYMSQPRPGAPPTFSNNPKGQQQAALTPGQYQGLDGYKFGMWMAAPLAGMFVSYVLAPSWVDELVSPMDPKKGVQLPWEHRRPSEGSWTSYAAKVQTKGLAGSWMVLRDVAHAMIDGGDVSSGILGEGFKYIVGVLRHTTPEHLSKHMSTKDKQKYLKEWNSFMNMMTGTFAPNSVPRWGAFSYNQYMGTERPKSFREWWTGITHGTVHPRHGH